MTLKLRKRWIFMALITLAIAGLACNLGRITAKPTPTAEPTPVSTQAVATLEENVQETFATAESGQPVSFTVTEDQLTSVVALQLQSQKDPILRDPQIFLRDGQVQVTGKVNQAGMELPLKMALTVSVDGQGQVQYKVVSGSLGPFPLPQSILDQLTAQLNETLKDQLVPENTNIVIEDINIGDGVMTVTGHTP